MSSSGSTSPSDDVDVTAFGEQLHSIYDRLSPTGTAERTADFLMWLTRRCGRIVTELGVGTGRIAIPLARRGAVVTGVDVSPSMLAVCRHSTHEAGLDLRLVEADIRTWRADAPADLVYCVAGTMSYLPTEQDHRRFLRVVASAVRPGGVVVIENHNPPWVRSQHDGGRVVEQRLPLAGSPTPVELRFVLDEGNGCWEAGYRWTDESGAAREAVEQLWLIEPDDVFRLAAEAGLSLHATYGDWTSGAPVDSDRHAYIAVFVAGDPTGFPRFPTDATRHRDTGRATLQGAVGQQHHPGP